jgi:cysteine-rich repeat protein
MVAPVAAPMVNITMIRHWTYILLICTLSSAFALAEEQAICYSSVEDLPATCTGTITNDTFDGCRHLTCATTNASLSVLACDKPDTGTRQYFEMYRVAHSGYSRGMSICLGETCTTEDGYVRSPNYPICSQCAELPTCEPGYTLATTQNGTCTVGTCVKNPLCGDGIIDAGETCDDSNTNSRDGCSSTCAIEHTCTLSAQHDGLVCTNRLILGVASGTRITNALIADANGNVGIGIIPTDRLDIAGRLRLSHDATYPGAHITSIYKGSTSGLTLTGRGSTYDILIANREGSDVFAVPTGTTNAYFAGNLGIGTTSPGSKLHVIGEANISGISKDGTGKVVCIRSDGNLGTCTTTMDATGTCTCN